MTYILFRRNIFYNLLLYNYVYRTRDLLFAEHDAQLSRL